MKYFLTIVIFFIASSIFAQRDFTPTKKRDAFGKRDFRDLHNYGIQFQLGATDFLTRLSNQQVDVATTTDGFRGNFTPDPYGKVGVYGEIGMFHFPQKRSKLSLALKTVLVSYYDWGVGFEYFRGGETIDANFIDAGGVQVSEETREYNFTNGSVYGRFAIHKNIHFKKHRDEKTNFFLDNSLGININYRVLATSDSYDWYSVMTENQQYTKPLQVQLHYGLGLGFRLKRGSYLIPGARIPLLGFHSTDADKYFGRPSMHWYSSRYWPIYIHVKYMFALEKKPKNGCPPVEINSQDKETQQGR